MVPLARFRVDDRSMEPTLAPGDYVLVNRWAYAFRDPAPGDLVVVRDPQDQQRFLAKRVAARTDAGEYVVVGDNALASRDSRTFGPVRRELVVGKVWRRVAP